MVVVMHVSSLGSFVRGGFLEQLPKVIETVWQPTFIMFQLLTTGGERESNLHAEELHLHLKVGHCYRKSNDSAVFWGSDSDAWG